jgi:hypothetical protein
MVLVELGVIEFHEMTSSNCVLLKVRHSDGHDLLSEADWFMSILSKLVTRFG